jgi:hypothetical protein
LGQTSRAFATARSIYSVYREPSSYLARSVHSTSPRGEALMTFRTLSDIRRHFLLEQRPTYFISATNFNLLGIDEWVNRFTCDQLHRLFRRPHPNVVRARRAAARRVREHRGHQQLFDSSTRQ